MHVPVYVHACVCACVCMSLSGGGMGGGWKRQADGQRYRKALGCIKRTLSAHKSEPKVTLIHQFMVFCLLQLLATVDCTLMGSDFFSLSFSGIRFFFPPKRVHKLV